MRIAVSGTFSLGLRDEGVAADERDGVHPERGPIAGKLKGVMPAQTPRG